MSRKWIMVMVIAVLILGCKRTPKDQEILPINTMKLAMWDMMRADEWYTQTTLKDTLYLRKKENIQLYEQVFAIHGTTRKQFYNSYQYYETHPKEFKVLMDSIYAYTERLKLPPPPPPVKIPKSQR
jgi:Domain of unknown function (DUF4296)